MSKNNQAAGKTFIFGEYTALYGSPALILTTPPYFTLTTTPANTLTSNIHPESPAGKFIVANIDFFQHLHVEFSDPYLPVGGFGASTAQFLLVYALKHPTIKDPKKLLLDYLEVAWDGTGNAPSGADLMAQYAGGITFFDKNKNILKSYPWPFPELEYGLIHTGNKIPTHTHLKKLPAFDRIALENIALHGINYFITANGTDWLESINHFADALDAQQLVAEHTLLLLDKLAACPDILAKKGCGALGADVILILFHKEKSANVLHFLKKNHFHLIQHGMRVGNSAF
ncbi:hypothetical protein AYO45_06975 [Gammaproteobacteria bacterium SCGC AG-212-F23]|nr:hypothetical protein AYO45_06975 [Gammaproteobacteria bacterium SCGC AG-212-F23]